MCKPAKPLATSPAQEFLVNAVRQREIKGAFARQSTYTIHQFILVSAIANHPDSNQLDLVRITGIGRSTINEMIRRLADSGLVAKGDVEDDQRATEIGLTADGCKLFKKMKARHGPLDFSVVPQPEPKTKPQRPNIRRRIVPTLAPVHR